MIQAWRVWSIRREDSERPENFGNAKAIRERVVQRDGGDSDDVGRSEVGKDTLRGERLETFSGAIGDAN